MLMERVLEKEGQGDRGGPPQQEQQRDIERGTHAARGICTGRSPLPMKIKIKRGQLSQHKMEEEKEEERGNKTPPHTHRFGNREEDKRRKEKRGGGKRSVVWVM